MMSRLALSALVSLSVAFVAAQAPTGTFPEVPLASKHFSYGSLPHQVDTDNLIRGTQSGYNDCPGKPDAQDAKCQTLHFNNLADFCLWAPAEKGKNIGDIEGHLVSWCTKKGHGSRLIPKGTILGAQWMVTSAYVQVLAYIQQEALLLLPEDYGGEMDPHGADLRGNPIGSLLFTTAFKGDNTTYDQVIEWHNFLGGNFTCLKACDPANADAPNFCEHRFDRIGAGANCPGSPTMGVFEVCEGETQDFPGTYVENGVTKTFTQPPESLGPITSIYSARVPKSSNCREYKSDDLWPDLLTVSGAPAAPTGTGTGKATGTNKATGSSTRTGTAAGAANTNGATTLAISSVALFGVVFSALFLS